MNEEGTPLRIVFDNILDVKKVAIIPNMCYIANRVIVFLNHNAAQPLNKNRT